MATVFLLMGPAPFLKMKPSVELIYGMLSLEGFAYGIVIVSTFARCHAAAITLGLPDTMPTYLLISGMVRLHFCVHCFRSNRKWSPFSRPHSHTSTNATRRHEYFQGLSRVVPVPEFWCHFLNFVFSEKWPFWLWEGALSPSQKSHLKVKMDIYDKINALCK